MEPLLDFFAAGDDVFTEHDSFDPSRINASLGRLYRAWLNCRTALDPEFDRDRYRYEQKQKPRVSVSGFPKTTPFMDQKSISETSRKKTAKPEKKSPKRSVRGAS